MKYVIGNIVNAAYREAHDSITKEQYYEGGWYKRTYAEAEKELNEAEHRILSKIEGKLDTGFYIPEKCLEAITASEMSFDDRLAYVKGFNDCRVAHKERMELYKAVIIDAIKEAFAKD